MPRNPDRTNLCNFTYADGRRCTNPQFPDDMGLCYHHGEKRHAFLESREAGDEISRFLDTDILTANDLSCTLSSLFAATVQGHIKPKVAASLGHLAQLMLQAQQAAKKEFLESFDTAWREVVTKGPAFNPPPDPEKSSPQSSPCPPASSDPAPSPPQPNPFEPFPLSSDDDPLFLPDTNRL